MLAPDAIPGEARAKHAHEAPAPQAPERRAQDAQSRAHGWPRLLDYGQAAEYLGVSVDLIREYVTARQLAPVRLPRPATVRDRRRGYLGDHVRRRLLDVRDLDRFVDALKTGNGARVADG
jgi:hypothetical protein